MDIARRLFSIGIAGGCATIALAQIISPDVPTKPPSLPGEKDEEMRLPNGKSQKNAIAEDQHKKAIAEADQLVKLTQQLRDELSKAGNFVVPVSSIRRTEAIEKLAKQIRSRLRD
jgi:hypothetical protein